MTSLGDPAHRLAADLRALAAAASDEMLVRVAAEVGNAAAADVDDAVRGDIGDQSMSGWRRGRPIAIVGDAKPASKGSIDIIPARPAVGPMRVLQSGRQSYAAGSARASGTRVRKSDGAIVTKSRKIKRNVGATKGKGTWSDAERLIEQRSTQRAVEVLVKEVKGAIRG